MLAYPSLRAGYAEWPPWLIRSTDLAVLSAPLVVAVVLAGRLAAPRIGRATGIRRWSWVDVILGIAVALVVRALVELVDPTTGTLEGPFGEQTLATLIGTVVLVAGLVAVTPLVEELFFRGLLQRALEDLLAGLGRVVAALGAVAASTGAFVWLHALPWAGTAPPALLAGTIGIGLGAGILTVVTGRLGGAITAHVVFNATAVLLMSR